MSALDAEIAAAVDLLPALAAASGAVLRQYFRRPVEVLDKEDETPVTVADREAEAALRRLIAERFPRHGILGEEMGAERPDSEFVWTLDPLDGTGQFISGVPLFGTLVALVHEGEPMVGLLDQPILAEQWIGAKGRPTLFNGRPVRTRACAVLEHATVFSTTPDMFAGPDEVRFDEVRRQVKRVRYGTDCYAYGLTALGFVDAVVEAQNKPWDICAHVPIIEGAGGAASGWRGERIGLQSDGRILACGDARLHEAMLRVLAD